MVRQLLEKKFEQVALELGMLTPEQERQVSEAVRNHPQPVPSGGEVAIKLGFVDIEVKTAVLMAQAGERMLQAIEVAHAPQEDPRAAEKAAAYTDARRYAHIGKIPGEDQALKNAQEQWKSAEDYALKRRTPGVQATPEQDAAAREIIIGRAEQSYRFAAAWLKVRAKEVAQQNPDQANAMYQAGAKLDANAQAIFVEARTRFQISPEAQTTAEQYELSVQQYREREKAKSEGKSWVNSTGRGNVGGQQASL